MPSVNATRAVGMVLLAVSVLACGERDRSSRGAADPWPMSLEDETVLGYAVVCLPPATRDGLLQDALGWTPDGLAADRPLGLVRFDSRTFGGPAAIVLSVDDGQALLASLEACPGIDSLGEDRYAFRPSLQSGLGMLLLLASGWEARSPMDVLSSIGNATDLEFVMQVRIEDDHALVVPSFEALAVCRDFLDEVRGFTDLRSTEGMLSLDLDQLRITYAEQIREADAMLQALVSGARLGGPLALLGGPDGVQDSDLGFSINWDLVWALRAMLDLESVQALQVRLAAAPDGDDRAESFGALLDTVTSAQLRFRLASDSALQPVLSALRPVPDDVEALLLLAADPDRFGPAFAAWCRPLADFAKGEGAPSDRYVDGLAALLAGWDGLVGVFEANDGNEAPVVLATVRGDGLDLAGVVAWLGPLLTSAGLEPLPADGLVEELGNGRTALRDTDGEIVLTTGRRGPVQWFVPGDAGEPPADLLIRFAGGQDVAGGRDVKDGPALRCVVRDARLLLRHGPGETLLDVILPGTD
jgi:hypothetical protein